MFTFIFSMTLRSCVAIYFLLAFQDHLGAVRRLYHYCKKKYVPPVITFNLLSVR